jgi:hypothetical protein
LSSWKSQQALDLPFNVPHCQKYIMAGALRTDRGKVDRSAMPEIFERKLLFSIRATTQ